MKYRYIFQSADDPTVALGSNSDDQARFIDGSDWITIDCKEGWVDGSALGEATDDELGILSGPSDPEDQDDDGEDAVA